MKQFKSTRLSQFNNLLPSDAVIQGYIEANDYWGYIPMTFLADLLIVSKAHIQSIKLPETEYVRIIEDILEPFNIIYWLQDTTEAFIKLSRKMDFRVLDSVALNCAPVTTSIPRSFNYAFDISSINPAVIDMLGLTSDQLREIEELPPDIAKVLTLANKFGDGFYKRTTNSITIEKPMEAISELVKIGYHKLADALFGYKLATKAYNVDVETTSIERADTMVIGYLLNVINPEKYRAVLNLLAVLVVDYAMPKIKVYDFIGDDDYLLKEFNIPYEAADYLISQTQLKLFRPTNEAMLETLAMQNPGAEVLFVPDHGRGCKVDPNMLRGCRVNVILDDNSRHANDFRSIANSTGGQLILI